MRIIENQKAKEISSQQISTLFVTSITQETSTSSSSWFEVSRHGNFTT